MYHICDFSSTISVGDNCLTEVRLGCCFSFLKSWQQGDLQYLLDSGGEEAGVTFSPLDAVSS